MADLHPTTPVEELREAARLMRERAEKATPGPWSLRDGWTADGGAHFRRIANDEHETVLEADGPCDVIAPVATAEHIASWHPAVAVAVADWLDGVGEGFEGVGDPHVWAELNAALAVARAYLGGDRG